MSQSSLSIPGIPQAPAGDPALFGDADAPQWGGQSSGGEPNECRATFAGLNDAVRTPDARSPLTFDHARVGGIASWPDDGSGVALANAGRIVRDESRPTSVRPREGGDRVARRTDLPGQLSTVLGLVRELAEKRGIECELRASLEAACEAARRQNACLATLAHELRSHLAPIRQAVHIASLSSATETQQRWSHAVIARQSLQMALLLNDVLDGSRSAGGVGPLRIELVDLATIVEAAVETAAPVLDAKRHRLSIEMPPSRVYCEVDPLRLTQVLSNLLTNAAKYTDPEGEIRVQVSCAGPTLTLCVSDTGIGLPAEALEPIFGLFTQLRSPEDRSEGGVGLGLALARHLVTLHGGTIEARSAGFGQGSQFIVQLPRYRSSAPAPVERMAATPTRAVRSRRVLIADDSPDTAEGLAMFLRLEGHEVTVALDGGQALASLAAFRPEFALLDLSMPVLNGYEVARAIRASDAAPVLVALTGWAQAGDQARTRAAGFDYHIAKPVEFTPLLELLAREHR